MTRKTVAAITLLAAGFMAAAVLSFPQIAGAWTWDGLPSNCSYAAWAWNGTDFTVEITCYNGSTLTGVTHILYGTSKYPAAPADPASFDSSLDSFLTACGCAAAAVTTTTTAPTTTSTGTSTTAAPTTTTSSTTTSSTTTTATITTTTTVALLPPTASFTWSAAGLAVTLTDTSTPVSPATIATVTWHFGDGANGVGATATHTYTTSGDFTILEIVTDSGGLASQASKTITISPFGGTAKPAEKAATVLGSASTATFGQTLAVYCVTSWGKVKPESGYGLSIVGSHQVNIWQKGCNALHSHKGPVALALLVLGHESAHALGIKSEHTADCYSLKKLRLLEKHLGIVNTTEYANARKIVFKKWGRC